MKHTVRDYNVDSRQVQQAQLSLLMVVLLIPLAFLWLSGCSAPGRDSKIQNALNNPNGADSDTKATNTADTAKSDGGSNIQFAELHSHNVSATAQKIKVPQEMSLQWCIKTGLRNNPDIAALQWSVKTACSERKIAAGQRWPTLHLAASYKRTVDDQMLVPLSRPGERLVFGNDLLQGDLVLSMPLFTGGRITSQIKAAKLLEQAARGQLARSREELVFNITSVFYRSLALHHVIESLKFSQKALREHENNVQNMIKQAKAAKVDLLRTEVRLADIKQNIVNENNRLRILRRVMLNLTGLSDYNGEVRLKGDFADVAGVSSNASQQLQVSSPARQSPNRQKVSDKLSSRQWETLKNLQKAYNNRPDLRKLENQLEAQQQSVNAARAGRWPSVYFEGAYGGRHVMSPSYRPLGKDTTEAEGFAGIVADVPLFEGGRIGERIRREQHKLSMLREQLRKLRLQIKLDVETAVLNIQSARQRILTTEAAIQQAKESLRIEREKYSLGKGSIVEVLDAQSALLGSQTNYYQAMADYNIAQAELKLATGNINN